MKRYLLTLLILLMLGAALGMWLLQDSGYAILSRGNTSVEMSLWLLTSAWFISLVIALIALDIVLHFLEIGKWWDRWRGARRQKTSNKAFQEGSIALAEGDYKKAERQLFNAARHSAYPFPAWTAAAKAAAENHAFDRVEQYFLLAEEKSNRLTVGLARSRLLISYGRLEQANIYLTRLYEQHPKNTTVIERYLTVLARLKKWDTLVNLLPNLPKPASENHDAFWEAIHLSCPVVFKGLIHQGGRIDRVHTQKKLQDFWKSLPRFLQKDSEMIVVYADALAHTGSDNDAEIILAEQIDRQWNNRAVEAYGRVRSLHPDKALAKAQHWKAQHPHNPMLLLTLGRLSLQNRQWPEARDYFEAALALHHHPDTQAELLRLLDRQDPQAAAHRRQETYRAQQAHLPDLPLPDPVPH
jgi:HemY protein